MDIRLALMEAITFRKIVKVRYNRDVIRLAPHLLFERKGDLFTSALNVEKAWRADEDPRLGQFKLAGLADITLTDDEFEPLPSFSPRTPRDDDVPILAV